ncbi:MAG: hypothetical protein KKF56_01095 [Nanoarchaeota archaeon]|nr:hypothetical protein [Nanoarchaeota archaeon]
MAGLFGVVSKKRCVDDLFFGTFYNQHRAQSYCGLAVCEDGKLRDYPHKGLARVNFPKERLDRMNGVYGIGSVSVTREPVAELSSSGGMILSVDGNIINREQLKDRILRDGGTFSGYRDPEEVTEAVLVSKIVSKAPTFEKGVENLAELVQGDFSIVALTNDGVYAARGWGRKPLILGRKDGSYAVSSESTAFANTGFDIDRDVEPGEIVFMDEGGIQSVKKLDLSPVKFGTFEWIYTAYPTSVVDGRSVARVRTNIGKALAKRYPVDADVVSPVPNSGRWHATGFAWESGLPYAELFSRFDYSDRSYTPAEQGDREEEARIKLIPNREFIDGQRIVLVDDSIVRGNQMLQQVRRLKELGAEEVHVRVACPPLMKACVYGKSTKRDEDCIARRMPVEEIQEVLDLDSLGFATVDDLEGAIGMDRDRLCLTCWGED